MRRLGSSRGVLSSPAKKSSGTSIFLPSFGLFSDLGQVNINSVPDITYSSTQTLTTTRTTPLKANHLTINSGINVLSTNYYLWIWCNILTLNLNSSLAVVGSDGVDAADPGCVPHGGNGGNGASGGGGGSANVGGCGTASGGTGSNSGHNGVFGQGIGCGVSVGLGGTGNGAAQMAGFPVVSGFSAPLGGNNSFGSSPTGPGFGCAGSGGDCSGGCGGGAGGGGGASSGGVFISCRQVVVNNSCSIFATGGSGGGGSNGNNGEGAGGGVCLIETIAINNPTNLMGVSLAGGSGFGCGCCCATAGSGNGILYSLNQAGTAKLTSFTTFNHSFNNL